MDIDNKDTLSIVILGNLYFSHLRIKNNLLLDYPASKDNLILPCYFLTEELWFGFNENLNLPNLGQTRKSHITNILSDLNYQLDNKLLIINKSIKTGLKEILEIVSNWGLSNINIVVPNLNYSLYEVRTLKHIKTIVKDFSKVKLIKVNNLNTTVDLNQYQFGIPEYSNFTQFFYSNPRLQGRYTPINKCITENIISSTRFKDIQNHFPNTLRLETKTDIRDLVLNRYKVWVHKHLCNYHKSREILEPYSIEYKSSSVVSPYVNLGVITRNELISYLPSDKKHSSAINKFLKEILWSDYYYLKLVREGNNFYKLDSKFKVNNAKDYLYKLKNSQHPLINSILKELTNKGFINNRLRMILVSYAYHSLGIPLVVIAQLLETFLIDFLPWNNYGGVSSAAKFKFNLSKQINNYQGIKYINYCNREYSNIKTF